MMRQQGLSLLEIMISVLVLSIGILGMATLQLQALKSNQSALTRTEATQYAYMINDMMRANRSAALNGQYNVELGEAVSGSSMAVQDLQHWKRVVAGLPSGDGAVSVSAGRATITIQWDSSRLATDPALRSMILRTDL
ncbi:type IV pilus modification protein PilV [Aeromonas allosaccharophila]|uniref:type IV pilus modification protein PilV n=1 Tax=Aeromonas allosaccharophila TaxID=656 RepID=UPI003985AC4C